MRGSPTLVVLLGRRTGAPASFLGEARRYAERLRAAGVALETDHYGRLFHGFVHLTGVVAAARAAVAEIAARTAEALGAEPPGFA